MATPDRISYWNKTKSLMFVMLGLWVFFGYVIHMFVEQLNTIVIFGFPLGFYMAAQGSLIAFVVMLFWFARRQNAIDGARTRSTKSMASMKIDRGNVNG
jgi:putative solute:sodium symporter small subunit